MTEYYIILFLSLTNTCKNTLMLQFIVFYTPPGRLVAQYCIMPYEHIMLYFMRKVTIKLL